MKLSREEVREVISKMKDASHTRGVPVNRKVNGYSITYYPRSAGNGWEANFQISGGHLLGRERIAEREIDSFVTTYATIGVWEKVKTQFVIDKTANRHIREAYHPKHDHYRYRPLPFLPQNR